MKNILTPEIKQTLELRHRKVRDVHECDRIKAILLTNVPLGRINRVLQYVLRPISTPHKSCFVKTYLIDLTAFRGKTFASRARYRTRRISKFPCRSVSLIFSGCYTI